MVTTPNVVLATNPPIHHNMTIHARLNPERSYAVGLQIPEVGYQGFRVLGFLVSLAWSGKRTCASVSTEMQILPKLP